MTQHPSHLRFTLEAQYKITCQVQHSIISIKINQPPFKNEDQHVSFFLWSFICSFFFILYLQWLICLTTDIQNLTLSEQILNFTICRCKNVTDSETWCVFSETDYFLMHSPSPLRPILRKIYRNVRATFLWSKFQIMGCKTYAWGLVNSVLWEEALCK